MKCDHTISVHDKKKLIFNIIISFFFHKVTHFTISSFPQESKWNFIRHHIAINLIKWLKALFYFMYLLTHWHFYINCLFVWDSHRDEVIMMIINGINNDNDIKITHENFITFSLHKIIVRMAIKLMKLCVCVCDLYRMPSAENQ